MMISPQFFQPKSDALDLKVIHKQIFYEKIVIIGKTTTHMLMPLHERAEPYMNIRLFMFIIWTNIELQKRTAKAQDFTAFGVMGYRECS